MNKLVPLVFSFLLLAPVGSQNAFAQTTFDFITLPFGDTPSIVEQDFTVTGSDLIRVFGKGLGIVRGDHTSFIDLTESITFTFNGAVIHLTYFVIEAGNENGNQTPIGEAFIEAFDSNGKSLGTVPISGEGIKDVSGSFGNVPISKFTVTANIDPHSIGSITYDFSQNQVIGGKIIPINSVALLAAGLQTSHSILTALVVIGSVTFGVVYSISKRK